MYGDSLSLSRARERKIREKRFIEILDKTAMVDLMSTHYISCVWTTEERQQGRRKKHDIAEIANERSRKKCKELQTFIELNSDAFFLVSILEHWNEAGKKTTSRSHTPFMRRMKRWSNKSVRPHEKNKRPIIIKPNSLYEMQCIALMEIETTKRNK